MAGDQLQLPKSERLKLFFDAMRRQNPAADHDGAMAQISTTLNRIEDEFSGVPYNPDQPGTDGRMYPPDERFRYFPWERPGVRCYRQTAHATFVGDNGSIEIRPRKRGELGDVSFEKEGADGRKVTDYDSTK